MAEQPESVLVVQFAAPGSTQFNIATKGMVTIAQLEVLAHELLATAQYTRWAQIHQAALEEQEEEEEQEPKIAVPGLDPHQVADILRGMKE